MQERAEIYSRAARNVFFAFLLCAQCHAGSLSVSQDTCSPRSLAARPPAHWNGSSLAMVCKKHKFNQGLYTCTDDRIWNSSQRQPTNSGFKQTATPVLAADHRQDLSERRSGATGSPRERQGWRRAYVHHTKKRGPTLGDRLTTPRARPPTQSTSSPTRGREWSC